MRKLALLLLLAVPLAAFGSEDTAAERARLRGLVERGVPGSAWFRHRLKMIGEAARFEQPWEREWQLDRTIGMVTGGRAVAENLALDRELLAVRPGEAATVPLVSIEGIRVRPFEFPAWYDGPIDTLAPFVPADQHAVFCPSFAALDDLLDEADRAGAGALAFAEDRAADALTRSRYEKRFGAPLELLRSVPVSQVVLTGSDLYYRTGSDLALLVAAPVMPGFTRLAEGVWFKTLSPAQAARLTATAAGTAPCLADTDEYLFFRTRYPVGEPGETAFAVVPDAALRRWCGPRWRIAASRRTRAAALLAEARAAEIAGDEPPEGIDAVRAEYGELEFLTPIADLAFDHVTPAEAAAYVRWRQGYESTWSRYYDPIGARAKLADGKLDLDLSIFPLRDDTDYAELRELAGESAISDFGGDPHPEALLHLILAVDRRSRPMRDLGEISLPLTGDSGLNLLDWIGSEVAVWVDDGEEMREFVAAESPDEFFGRAGYTFPVAISVKIRNPLALAGFLTAVRTSVLASAPGVVTFETRTHGTLRYVRISSGPEWGMEGPGLEELCYATFGGALVLTLSEATLVRAMDRYLARKSEESPAPPASAPWPGKALALRGTAAAAPFLEAVAGGEWRSRMEERWRDAQPILEEWRRLYPDEDPVAVHERLFGERITDPRKIPPPWQLYRRAAFGITFENGGLRARAVLER